jgi:hypothetical protein
VARRSFAFAIVALVACLGSFGFSSAADAQQPAAPRRIGVLLAVFFSPRARRRRRSGRGCGTRATPRVAMW